MSSICSGTWHDDELERAVMVWCGPGYGHARVLGDDGRRTRERVFVHRANRAQGALVSNELMLFTSNSLPSIPSHGSTIVFWRQPARDGGRYDLASPWVDAEHYDHLRYVLTASLYRIVDPNGRVHWEGAWSHEFSTQRPHTSSGRLPSVLPDGWHLDEWVMEDFADQPYDQPSLRIAAGWEMVEEGLAHFSSALHPIEA